VGLATPNPPVPLNDTPHLLAYGENGIQCRQGFLENHGQLTAPQTPPLLFIQS
jgi:hypothetical protein